MTHEWTASEAAALNQYLIKSDAAIITALRSCIPKIKLHDTSTVESIALAGAYKQGAEDIIDALIGHSKKEPKQDDASNGGFSSM